MSTLNKTIGIIGCGNMGKALIKGLVNSGLILPERLMVSDKFKKNSIELHRKYKVKIAESNMYIARFSDIIVIAVKPKDLRGLFIEIYDMPKSKLVISIAAGITTKSIESAFKNKVDVIRAMPNTPALVGEAMTVVCRGRFASKKDIKLTHKLFESIGKVEITDERHMDAVTAISGSGPAYFFYFIEALTESAVELGLDEKLAHKLVLQTAKGSVELLSQTKKPPRELREAVTSKKGTTEAALDTFLDNKFHEIIKLATKKAKLRSRQISRQCL